MSACHIIAVSASAPEFFEATTSLHANSDFNLLEVSNIQKVL